VYREGPEPTGQREPSVVSRSVGSVDPLDICNRWMKNLSHDE
jgi:hypothetical protein